jgi:peptidoglycan/xylan/chitin deacetylase (PgdA/CDA1 family)
VILLLLAVIGTLALAAAVIYFFFASPWSQLFGRFVWRVPTTEKVVALTFDDGPNDPWTCRILDVLETHGASATFFMVGMNVEREPELARRIAGSRHEIGNHSYAHRFRRYLTQPGFTREMRRTQKLLLDIAGTEPVLFRPPWLWRTPMELRSAARLDLVSVGGTFCHSLEVFQPSAQRIARAALRKIKPGAIVIFHDGLGSSRDARRGATVQAVELVASRLAQEHWEMVTVSELLRRHSRPATARGR